MGTGAFIPPQLLYYWSDNDGFTCCKCSIPVISAVSGVLLTLTHESPQADQASRGSKTVEELLTDGNEYEVCHDPGYRYEIRTARRVQLQWRTGQFVSSQW